MQLLSKAFQKHLNFQLPQPLKQSGEIQQQDFRIKYVLTKDASEESMLDLLIFERDAFPPVHKRIKANGEITELENFQFSVMYEFPEERRKEEILMQKANRETAKTIINKGLTEKTEEWIKKYL